MRRLAPTLIIGILLLVLSTYMLNALPIILPQTAVKILWLVPIAIYILVAWAMRNTQKNAEKPLFIFSFNALLVYFASVLVFDIVLLINDCFRFFFGFFKLLTSGHFNLPKTSPGAIYLASLLSITVIIVFIYGILIGKYSYRVIKHNLYFDNLPEAFEGFKIVQISDVHAGSLKNVKAVQKGIDLIKTQQADIFVFTGDLVNNKAEEIKPYINHFSQIKAPYGKFSVLGNHDYGDYIKWPTEAEKRNNLASLKEHHASMGFTLLLDENTSLTKNGQSISLLGVENWGLGFGQRGNLQKALSNTSATAFKILLSHDPTHWEKEVKQNPSKINLTLAGHTHGMQFGIEAFGIKWSPVKYRYKHWAGIKEENGRILNINRGFGFIGFSGRVGIWPEITVIELRKK